MRPLSSCAGFAFIEVIISLIIVTSILTSALFIALRNTQQSQQAYYYAIAMHSLDEFEKNIQHGSTADDFSSRWLVNLEKELPEATASIDVNNKITLCWNYGGQQCITS